MLLYAPAALQQMIAEAIEVGYATALREVQNGDFDDKLREWHPTLFEELVGRKTCRLDLRVPRDVA
ncbi:hypothetical protein [Streptomyces zagrosensis]|uniref:Uncharacterized protein n=1 Tax=Streptomyces zagrosensis TaxID=1042984 RepID=A0A7W9QFS3_9ACTN|nr:hypothetical protein [Streptomyces zagrosensis]MBB5939460.1 hypothetical protein [Streptomyces zagrosensis]